MNNIIKYDTKIMVSRYNNKQLTIYSNNVASQCKSYGMIIPFQNKYNKVPIILNTVVDDNKIFKIIDNCFSNNSSLFNNILNRLYDIRYSKTVKNISLPDNLNISGSFDNNLPIIYYNNYKYCIAKNSKELQQIDSTEMNFYLTKHNIEEYEKPGEYGFIVLWVENTNTPLAMPAYYSQKSSILSS